MSCCMSSKPPLFESELLVLAQCGDHNAQDQVVGLLGGIEPICGHTQGGGIMLTLARRTLGVYHLSHNCDAVYDVVSETYRSILDETTARYDPSRGTIIQYLVGLTRNAARKTARQYAYAVRGDILDTDRSQNRIDGGVESDGGSWDLPGSGEAWYSEAFHADTPDSILIEREMHALIAERVEKAIGVESLDLQGAIRQHYWTDAPVSTVAEQLGMERTSLGRRMAACRRRLARSLRAFSDTYYN